jgi:DNA-binding GntR family transcriptional regulator
VKAQAEHQAPEPLPLVVPQATGYTTKQDYVASLLREAIVSGQLRPGRRLRQDEVARQLGLSWTPVREAFRQLEAEGWLTIEHHRGAVVAPLSLEDFEDIYLLRLAVEPLAARLSAERADRSTVEAMEQLDRRMQRLDLSRAGDWVTYLQLEREFHRALYHSTGRQRLFELVMSLRDAAHRYLQASFSISDEPFHHQQVHVDLLAACRRRDSAAAEETMCRALDRVMARMRPLLLTMLERQPEPAS